MSIKSCVQTFESFCEIINAFSPCMNDYLYVYDLSRDLYYITDRAVQRFTMPDNLFGNVLESHRLFCHPDDYNILVQDLKRMLSGEQEEHNLEYRWMGRDGSPIWIKCMGRIIKDENNVAKLMIGCVNEIGNTQKADNISGLLGESSFFEHLKALLPSLKAAMLMRVGIDDFKIINERFGMDFGNTVLRKVAGCIQDALDPMQYVYRIVSDEFIILDISGAGFQEMNTLYHRIRSFVDQEVAEDNYKAVYTISAGLTSLNDLERSLSDYGGYTEAMKISEFALAEAKARGKNQLYFFCQEDYSRFLKKRYLLSCLRQSLSDNFNGFDLNFQPIIQANGEYLYAAEALLRYRTPSGEAISPMDFIPVLEESGLIIPVGKWIIRNSLAVCKKVRKTYPDFRISINLSYIQLLKTALFEDIRKALLESGLPPDCLIVELTESGHLEDTVVVKNVWDKLRKFGVHIALDDFGTGYSNLINIGNLRPNIVKIDRSFTIKALQNTYEFELLVHIIRMVHSIGLNLVVEGIETLDELTRITELNPDFIQGFYYSKPCTRDSFFNKYRCA